MVAEVAISPVYISTGCNRTSHCVSWSSSGLVAYGSGSSVAIYCPERGKVVRTLVEQKDRVNCVSWVDGWLIAGSTDSSVVVWRCQGETFTKMSTLKGHTGSVTAVAGLQVKDRLIVATASGDCTVKIWSVGEEEESECCQTISLKTGFALDVSLCVVPGESLPLLLLSLDDCKVHVYQEVGGVMVRLGDLAGSEDWASGIGVREDGKDLLVAAASQDSLVRVWRISPRKDHVVVKETKEIKPKEVRVGVAGGGMYAITLDTVMAGHEDNVYSVKWAPGHEKRILTASRDKTMVVWQQEEDGVWTDSARVGDVGGNTLGFIGAEWSPKGDQILGHSFSGSFHLWRKDAEGWRSCVTVGGHQGPVADLSWEPRGRYLVSVSKDQTARLHGLWKGEAWHEVARPQVHGYDLTCIATTHNHKYVSGAEEKVLRAFQAPSNFLDNFCAITGETEEVSDRSLLPQGASVPSLGLSNKAVFEGEKVIPEEERHVKDQYPDFYFTPETYSCPPPEETLVQNTLWPELHKMYGHGYELFCIATNHKGSLVASACKSSKSSEASVIVWSVSSWKQVAKLPAHSLTVTQLAFSPDDSHLLAVSRDRSWSLHSIEEVEEGGFSFSLMAMTDKKTCVHQRLIWTCSWTHDSQYFVTGSRDKKVVVWGKVGGDINTPPNMAGWGPVGEVLVMGESVTAVDVAPRMVGSGGYLVAVGMDNGEVELHEWRGGAGAWSKVGGLERGLAHHATVSRLAWRPGQGEELMLASCSSDQSVRIYKVSMET